LSVLFMTLALVKTILVDNSQGKLLKIAVAGDSMSVGCCPMGLITSWPSHLRAKLNSLGEDKYKVDNFALGRVTHLKPIDNTTDGF